MSPFSRRQKAQASRIRRRGGRAAGRVSAHGGVERLESRAMFAAVPFEPVNPDGATSWLYSPVSPVGSYHPADPARPASATVKLDAVPSMIIPPAGMTPQQTWPLPDGGFLALFGSSVGQGEFRRFSPDGVQLGWSTAVGGRVKDVLQTSDGGFLIWGNVTTDTETSWLRGGFDTSWNGGLDGFVARVTSTGLLEWSTLVGGPGHDTVASVALSPDGSTLFVIGDTSSSGNFVHGTADQVFDATGAASIVYGKDPSGKEADLTVSSNDGGELPLPVGFQVTPSLLGGAASSTNGYVMVMSADGQKHLWSSYLSPNDDVYNPSPSGSFIASSAAFVSELPDLTQGETGPSLARAALVVNVGSGGANASTSLVTLVEQPAVRNVNTGALERDFAFTAVEPTGLPDVFLTAIRSKPLNADPTKAYYYYMSAVSTPETDITSEWPFFEIPGREGTPSVRALGRVSFGVGARGEATVTRDLDLGVSSFSLTGFYPTADAIYLTGTTLSSRNLGFGTQFSGYHTAQYPLNGLVGNNYGDVVLAELAISGTPIRSQVVGNVVNGVGLKEKGGGIVVLPSKDKPGVDVKLFGGRYIQPVNGASATPLTGGRLWTYYDSTKDKTKSLPVFSSGGGGQASAVRPETALPQAVYASTDPKLQWTGYVNSTIDADSVTDVWSIPKNTANGLAENLVVLQTGLGDAASRTGWTSGTWSPSGWNDGIKGGVAQIQLSGDGTKLYAAGTTTTPSWTQSGFDNTLSTWFNTDNNETNISSDGFFARVDVRQQKMDYSTYLGGQGETFNDRVTPFASKFTGTDSSAAFYVDSAAVGGDVYVVGTSNARSGRGSRDGVTDQVPQEKYFETVRPGGTTTWPNGAFDDRKSVATDARVYDATIYSLNDRLNGGNSSSQLDWASYLTPRVQGTVTDDNEGPTRAYLIMRSAEYVWRAKDSSGPGNLIYVFGNDVDLADPRNEGKFDAPTRKAIYVFRDTSPENLGVNDLALSNDEKIQKFVSFQWNKPDQILVAGNHPRPDGPSDQTSVYFRTASEIQRIDLPSTASWSNPMKDLYIAWTTRAVGGLPFNHMATNGSKIYVASTTAQSAWDAIPPVPLEKGGKLRNGPSDAVLMQVDALKGGAIDWWMIQGGDGAETGTGVAAYPDGRVMLFGATSSRKTDVNETGWVPDNADDTRDMLGNRAPAPSGAKRTYTGGLSDAFSVVVQTSNVTTPPSKAEAEVGGVVGGVAKPIAAGSVTASAATGTDFGRVIQGGPAVSRTFRIQNLGTEVLTLNVGSLPAWLTADPKTPLPASLGVGQSVDWTLTMNPGLLQLGALTGKVAISTNDANESDYFFAVKAEVITPPPSTTSVTVSPAQVTEGNSATTTTPVTFTVTFAPGIPAPTYPVTVNYAIVGVDATAGVDFTGSSGTLTFASATDLVKTVVARVKGDTEAEAAETFKLVLSSPSQGVVSTDAGQAIVTITNDDGPVIPPSVGFAPAAYRAVEGAAGVVTRVPLTVRLTKAQTKPVVVQYTTANVSASAGSDYTAKSGALEIPAGQTQVTFNVAIMGDSLAESDETFVVRLSGATGVAGIGIDAAVATVTIVNDDGAAAPPSVRASNVSINEGNTGLPRMTFTITLAKALTTATTLTYSTLDGTAKAGRDYQATSGTVTIAAGRTTATVTVPVIANRVVDGNRTLSLQVRSGSTLVATGVGTIIDDDKAAVRAAFAAFAAEPVSTGVTKKK